ncbi:heat shock protein DnaJ domain protein [Oscillatoria nigro-viridis PCC 7112]|uniref:Heat shock protein DnaJ domain protein n=1 Tax=Phormidium nigroviride PCC 7112 TaxID=179408 RepID=K9VRE0_9CYAN|nr:tetratricopeptide repeat protein [Oscillatoria nigro-viridis]AFZ10114.1 heat shock protein DnaJ domain protein [Oscillatoria nigro-viridis PCC 7112]
MDVFVDYYQLLSLEPGWDTDRLRKALKNAFRGNQGRINVATGKKREEIEQRQALIPKAQKILLDPDAKAKYDQELAEWKQTATPFEVAAAAAIPTLLELWQLIDDGRYRDAVEGGKKLVQHTPNDYLAWEVYARANYYCKEYRTAVSAAEQAIRCNPQKAELYADAGEYLAADEQWDKAVLQLHRAIQLEPNNSGYKLNLASIYIGHEIWADAEALLKGVLSQEPSNSTARYFMAIVINDRASERISEVVELANSGKQGQARKILKEIQRDFDEAQKLAGNNLELLDLLSSNSIQVRRWLGVNFYYRLFGFSLDGVLASPGFALMAIDGGTNQLATIGGVIVALAIWGYSWVWLAYKNCGQDLIKRLLGMQIVSDDQRLPSLGQLITRAIIKPFNFFLAYLVFGLIIVFSMFGHLGQMGSGVAAAIGMTVGLMLIGLRIFWDLFFVTSKEVMPTFFGSALFMHEKIARTTVVAANKNDVMNFGEYHWF